VADPLETVEIETGDAPRAAVVWMHGLGADGHDFEPVVPALGLPKSLPVRFVFPHAPMRPVTINNGWVMRAWYDVAARGGGAEDEAGLRASRELVEALIAREARRGIPARSLVLAGFSQGGALALLAGLRHPERFAGILALSCYLPLADALAGEAAAANRDVPILMAHGTYDDVIPVARARASRDRLVATGYTIDWREYPMSHAVCDQEIRDIGTWLQNVLSNPRPR
jgi:phospholipase/carboxylesterase